MSDNQENTKKKKKFFDNIDLTPYRKDGESVEEYKARRKANKQLEKAYSKGKRVYDPHQVLNLPKMINGEVQHDEKGEVIYTDKKFIIGPYYSKLYGKLPD